MSSSKIIWIVLFLILFANTLFSNNPPLSLYGIVKFLELFFFGYYITKISPTKKELSNIAYIMAAGVILQSLLAIAQYIGQSSLNGIFYFLGERKFTSSTPGIANASINGQLLLRPYGTFSHPNVLAGYLLCMLVFIYSLLGVRNDLYRKIFKTSALLLGSTALFLTLSRVAIILWILIVSALLFKKVKKQLKNKATLPFVNVIIFAALIVSIITLTPILPRLTATNITEEAIIQRTDLFKSALLIIQSRPVFGTGLYNFIPVLATIQKPISQTLYFQPVHNIFLLLTAETGLTGLALFLLLLYMTFRHLTKNPPPHYAITLLIILLFILTLGFFDHYWLTLQQGQLLLAFIIGISWAT